VIINLSRLFIVSKPYPGVWSAMQFFSLGNKLTKLTKHFMQKILVQTETKITRLGVIMQAGNFFFSLKKSLLLSYRQL
jgi:hypothetical protein